MFKTLKLGCLAYSLVMLVPTLAVVAVLLLAGSATGMLPKPINDSVLSVEQFAARQWLNMDLGAEKLSVRDISVSPAKTVGHATLSVSLDSSVPLPADPKPLMVAALGVVGDHFAMPFGLAADQIDSVTILLYAPGATTPTHTATVSRADLDAYKAGTLSGAALAAKLSYK
jgi:hypothetical protein